MVYCLTMSYIFNLVSTSAFEGFSLWNMVPQWLSGNNCQCISRIKSISNNFLKTSYF